MTPERWQQIYNVLQRVVDIGAVERTALLDKLCTGDEGFRQEVDSLINFQQMAQKFLEIPALEEAASLFCDDEANTPRTALATGGSINSFLNALTVMLPPMQNKIFNQ